MKAPDPILDPLEHACRSVGEHYDSPNVAVFVSWVENGKTHHAEYMTGNAFALQNHIMKWVTQSLSYQQEEDDEEGD